jgi:dienelactone hydrolase
MGKLPFFAVRMPGACISKYTIKDHPHLFWLFLLVAIAIPSPVKSQELTPGQVFEKITCKNDQSQSYALYLPSNYSPARKWPILYALDAGARGFLPVLRFKAAAEKYGYIIAGSNNSRNGPIEIVTKALSALIADTESRFAVDNQRVYMTGFSGGARVAVAAAVALKGKVAGVIGCGAGFPPSIQPSVSEAFAFLGAVGVEDFNVPELRVLDDALDKLGAAHKLEIFKGGHEWPPDTVCTRAIEWLEIQAVKSGILSRSAGRIDEIFSGAVAETHACESRQEFYEAYRHYSALAKDFAGLKDIGEFKARAAELEKRGDVRNTVNREKAIDDRQNRMAMKLSGLLADSTGSEIGAFRIQELISSFISLRKQADQTGNEADRLVAVRVLAEFSIRLNEEASLAFEQKDYSLAALRLELMTQIQPENPRIFYHLSRAYARAGDKKKAVKAIQTAVSKGFNDAAEVRNNPDFEILKGDPAFQNALREFR